MNEQSMNCKRENPRDYTTESPNYTLKTNEAVLMPIGNNNFLNVFKGFVWIIAGIIILGSVLLQENLFFELSGTTRIIFVCLLVSSFLCKEKTEYMPSPMELQFYDDYLVLYLPKRYYSSRVTRKEINTMKYADISKCVYETKSKRVYIYGDGQSVLYNYKKDGSLPLMPTEERNFTQGLIYFNAQLATDVDFKKEIEEHSPIKVVIEND